MSRVSGEVAYYWYIEPLNDHTNEVIARELAQESSVALVRGRRCADGQMHNLWRCDHILIERLRASRKTLGISFRAFSQRGSSGPIREWKLPKGRRRSLRTKILREAGALTAKHQQSSRAS